MAQIVLLIIHGRGDSLKIYNESFFEEDSFTLQDEHLDEEFIRRGELFAEELEKKKTTEINWYPYNSISNIYHINDLIPREFLMEILNGKNFEILDIGAADGDIGFFMESLGCSVDFLDNPPTNYNSCKGLHKMKYLLNSNANIIIQDIEVFSIR